MLLNTINIAEKRKLVCVNGQLNWLKYILSARKCIWPACFFYVTIIIITIVVWKWWSGQRTHYVEYILFCQNVFISCKTLSILIKCMCVFKLADLTNHPNIKVFFPPLNVTAYHLRHHNRFLVYRHAADHWLGSSMHIWCLGALGISQGSQRLATNNS